MLRKMTPQQQVLLEKYLVEKDIFEKAQEVYDVAQSKYNEIRSDFVNNIWYEGKSYNTKGTSYDTVLAYIKNKCILFRRNDDYFDMEEESSSD